MEVKEKAEDTSLCEFKEKIKEFYIKKLHISEERPLESLINATEYREYNKGEKIIQMGEEQKNVFFLLSGIFRGFFVDINGREITDCFGYKKGTPIMSTFQFDMPSPVYIEASEYCEVLSVPIDKVLELLHENTSIVRVYNCMLQEALNKQWQTKVILYQYTAMQKYEWFLET